VVPGSDSGGAVLKKCVAAARPLRDICFIDGDVAAALASECSGDGGASLVLGAQLLLLLLLSAAASATDAAPTAVDEDAPVPAEEATSFDGDIIINEYLCDANDDEAAAR
jgi:hypothetical protein